MSGVLASLFERRALDENSGWGLIKNIRLGMQGYSTPAGVTMTPDRAVQITAVFAAIRVLAEGLASLPLVVYRRLPGGGKERAVDHPLYDLLHNQPNPEITSFMFRETLQGHLCTFGNCYAEIETDGRGRIAALWPLQASETEPRWVDGRLYYVTTLPEKFNHERVGLPAERVLHIRGLSPDGLSGYSPIQLARRALGLAAAAEEYGSAFFGNGAQPGGVLEHPAHLSPEAHARLKTDWEVMHQGLENSHRIAILEEGMAYKQTSIPPEDAQFLETRKFQISEIARIYRVPPHMLADLDRATFSNIEHLSLEFVNFTLRPWMVRWEQEILRCLFTRDERKTYFAEFLVDGLLRGDIQSRYAAYHTAWQDGWINWNEIREKENLNPIPGGDTHYVPLNMMPVEQAANLRSFRDRALISEEIDLEEGITTETGREALRQGPSASSGQDQGEEQEERSARSAGTRRRLMLSHQPLLTEAAGRVIRREAHDLAAGARRNFKTRSYADFEAWLDEFFAEHQEFIVRTMGGVTQAYAELIAAEAAEEAQFAELQPARLVAFVKRYLEGLASRHVFDSRERITKTLKRAQEEGEDPVEAISKETGGWEETRPASIGRREATRLNGAASKFIYAAAGATVVRWRTYNKSCPYCQSLDGKRVGINESFLAAGDVLNPEGAEGPLHVHSDVGHPPAHDGCDCMIGL